MTIISYYCCTYISNYVVKLLHIVVQLYYIYITFKNRMLHVVINNCMLHVFVPRKVPISDYPGYAE